MALQVYRQIPEFRVSASQLVQRVLASDVNPVCEGVSERSHWKIGRNYTSILLNTLAQAAVEKGKRQRLWQGRLVAPNVATQLIDALLPHARQSFEGGVVLLDPTFITLSYPHGPEPIGVSAELMAPGATHSPVAAIPWARILAGKRKV